VPDAQRQGSPQSVERQYRSLGDLEPPGRTRKIVPTQHDRDPLPDRHAPHGRDLVVEHRLRPVRSRRPHPAVDKQKLALRARIHHAATLPGPCGLDQRKTGLPPYTFDVISPTRPPEDSRLLPDTPAIARWDLAETSHLLAHPAVRLLRSPHAAFTLTFLHRAFKEHQTVSVPESHLRARLENFLDEARALEPDSYAQSAADYLAAWCGQEQLLLKKLFSEEAEEPVFELTKAAERAMRWLEDLQARPFVGAESRLELIFRQLEEIALLASPDTERRLDALRAQQDALQAEIDALQAGEAAATLTPVQLTERFANTLDLARALTSDFRELEDNFKEVARSLAEAQARPGATKGRIVGQLLDTHAALKESPQGQSFYAFWNLLCSPERQQRLRELVRSAYQLEAIDTGLRANRLLERLSSRLLVEGERVVRSNERTAATLRRALESAISGEDQRLRQLVREIQQLALACRDAPPEDDSFFTLPAPPELFASFSRGSWEPDTAGRVAGALTFATHTLDLALIERFRALTDLNLARLREHLRACLLGSSTVLLSDVLARFPPRDGVLEIVGYLVIALQDAAHYVPADQFAEIILPGDDGAPARWRVPQVLFGRAA